MFWVGKQCYKMQLLKEKLTEFTSHLYPQREITSVKSQGESVYVKDWAYSMSQEALCQDRDDQNREKDSWEKHLEFYSMFLKTKFVSVSELPTV